MRRNSISAKLKRSILLVVIPALLVSNLLIFGMLRAIYSRELRQNYKNIVENVTEHIENELQTVMDLGQTVCVDAALQRLIIAHSQDTGYDYYRDLREIGSVFLAYISMHSGLVDDIYLIDRNKEVISRNEFYLDTLNSDWFQEAAQGESAAGFTKIHEVKNREDYYHENSRNVITYISTVNDLEKGISSDRFMGYVLINVRCSTLMQEAAAFNEFLYSVYDAEGALVGSNDEGSRLDPEQLSEEAEEVRIGGDYYFIQSLPQLGWKVVSRIPFGTINQKMRYVAILSALVMLLFMIVSVRLVSFLARSITEPLQKLASGMDQFSQGELDAYVNLETGDEVEQIADVYNQMVDSIHNQMDMNIRREKEKNESEMRLLMAQIKPHFIYNSLNSIIYLARQRRHEDIIRYTRAFISVLQASIRKKPNEETSIDMEVTYIRNYLTMFEYRFGSVPEFSCEVEEGTEDTRLPALLIQPLVENSMVHGMKNGKLDGKITLRIRRTETGTRVEICDNGCGIGAESLARIRKDLENGDDRNESGEHIGLTNVNERLKRYYGDSSRLYIDSKEGEGTCVWFELRCIISNSRSATLPPGCISGFDSRQDSMQVQ